MPKFEKGHKGYKPKGAVNRLTRTVKETFADAFNELQSDDKVKLTVWGRENPTQFYQLASKLIPTEVKQEVEVSGIKNIIIDFVEPKDTD